VEFLSDDQAAAYERFVGDLSRSELEGFFLLDGTALDLIANKRGEHNRLGFGLQIGTRHRCTSRAIGARRKGKDEPSCRDILRSRLQSFEAIPSRAKFINDFSIHLGREAWRWTLTAHGVRVCLIAGRLDLNFAALTVVPVTPGGSHHAAGRRYPDTTPPVTDPASQDGTGTTAPADTQRPPWERTGEPFDPQRAWALIEKLRGEPCHRPLRPRPGPTD
jgi:hypothetical protein